VWLCRELGQPEHVAARAWALNHPAVATAVVGIRTAEQLGGLTGAAELDLSPEAISRLDEIFNINRGRSLRPGAAPRSLRVVVDRLIIERARD
jgi:aryl-alcohol dehydrogenase-like predicted oxidoreductase